MGWLDFFRTKTLEEQCSDLLKRLDKEQKDRGHVLEGYEENADRRVRVPAYILHLRCKFEAVELCYNALSESKNLVTLQSDLAVLDKRVRKEFHTKNLMTITAGRQYDDFAPDLNSADPIYALELASFRGENPKGLIKEVEDLLKRLDAKKEAEKGRSADYEADEGLASDTSDASIQGKEKEIRMHRDVDSDKFTKP